MTTLKRDIKLLGITQNEAAEKLNIGRAYLSCIINGHATPSPPLAKKIADLVGKTIEECNFF